MYVVKRENVERIVTEAQKDRLLAQGFTLVQQPQKGVEPKKIVEPRGDTEEYELEDSVDNEKALEDMTVDELQAYAEGHDIDLGRATSKSGIIEKIQNKG